MVAGAKSWEARPRIVESSFCTVNSQSYLIPSASHKKGVAASSRKSRTPSIRKTDATFGIVLAGIGVMVPGSSRESRDLTLERTRASLGVFPLTTSLNICPSSRNPAWSSKPDRARFPDNSPACQGRDCSFSVTERVTFYEYSAASSRGHRRSSSRSSRRRGSSGNLVEEIFVLKLVFLAPGRLDLDEVLVLVEEAVAARKTGA